MTNQTNNKTLFYFNDFCSAVAILWARLLDKLAFTPWPKLLSFSLMGLLLIGALEWSPIFAGAILTALIIKLLTGKNRQTRATSSPADKGLNDEKIR